MSEKLNNQEIEVTREMVVAGVAALRRWVPVEPERSGYDDADAVRDAFLSMHSVLMQTRAKNQKALCEAPLSP